MKSKPRFKTEPQNKRDYIINNARSLVKCLLHTDVMMHNTGDQLCQYCVNNKGGGGGGLEGEVLLL